MLPMTGSVWPGGNSCSASKTMALEDVNAFSGLLDVYNLTNDYIDSMIACSPVLSDRKRFKKFFGLAAPDHTMNPAFVQLFHTFNWRRLAIIHEALEFFSMLADELVEALKEADVEVISKEVFIREPMSRIKYLKARAFCFCLGLTLMFGSLFSKTWRVYRIFTNKELRKMSYTNGNDEIVHQFIRICFSTNSSFFTWSLYIIEGALLSFGAFLAFETRNLHVVYNEMEARSVTTKPGPSSTSVIETLSTGIKNDANMMATSLS